MKIVPVIFEDHNLAQMRPVSWSTPVFELRCGMFNTRERVGMCFPQGKGVLLGRGLLRNLHTASDWDWGAENLSLPERKNSRFLFLNGLLAPDFPLIGGLFEVAQDCPDFVWRSEQGLLAAVLTADQAVQAGQDWDVWEQAQSSKGAWSDPAKISETWTGGDLLREGKHHALEHGGDVLIGSGASGAASQLVGRLANWETLQADGPRWIWDIVGCTSKALGGDLKFVREGVPFRREPFGIFPNQGGNTPDWLEETKLGSLTSRMPADLVSRLVVDAADEVFCGEGVNLSPGTALNTEQGPIILDRGVRIMPQCYLEGPLYIGPGSLVKPGTRLHGESSFGVVNRLAGEIGESTFGDFANKQHEGFIGHAVLGSWINLGAMTTCSDLKNNYGAIRVDLGSGTVDTGKQFIGLMMGDHAKTAIGALFNTGTCVGFATNIFGAGMPPKFVGNFMWGGQEGCPPYAVDRARATAEMVMRRRGCRFTAAHGYLFTALG